MNVGEIREDLATGVILDIDRIGQIVNQCPENGSFVQDVLFCALALGDVLVGAQNPNDLPLLIVQGEFACHQPAFAAVGPGLWFFNVELGGVCFHHQPVVLDIRLCIILPSQFGVILAVDGTRIVKPGIFGKRSVAAEVGGIAILPKDALWYRVQDQLEHSVSVTEILFCLPMFCLNGLQLCNAPA